MGRRGQIWEKEDWEGDLFNDKRIYAIESRGDGEGIRGWVEEGGAVRTLDDVEGRI